MAYERINFQNYPSTATPLDANNLNKMDAELKYLDDNIALMLPSGTVAVPYNATTQYHEGNLVLNNQKLWKAKTDSRGVTPVEGSEWTETSISAELSNVSTGRDLSLEAFMAGIESGEITDHDNKDYYIEDENLAVPNAYNIDYGESTVGATLDAQSDEIANYKEKTVNNVVFRKNGTIVTADMPNLSNITINAWGVVDICSIPQGYRPVNNGQVFYPVITQSIPNDKCVYFRTNNGSLSLSSQSSNSATFATILATTLTWMTNEK